MKFNIQLAKVTGSPGKSGWAQVHDFTPQQPEKLELKGRLIAVISTTSMENQEGDIERGREILTRLHEEYYGNQETGAFNTLRLAVEKVMQEFTDEKSKLEIAAACLLDGVLYSVACGGSQVSVLRNNMMAKILASPPDQVVTASGYPQEGDVLILATSDFFQNFSEGIIKATLESRDIVKVQDFFTPAVYYEKDLGRLGVVFVFFEPPGAISTPSQELIESETIEQTREGNVKDKFNRLGLILTKLVPKKRIYIKNRMDDLETIKKKKLTMSVGIILILVLLVSIGFGLTQRNKKEREEKYIGRITQAEHNYQEAVNLSSISKDRSRELIVDARKLIDELISEGVKDERVTALKTKIENEGSKILGEYNLESQLFLDLSLLSSGFSTLKMSSGVEMMYLLDKEGRRIAEVSITDKKSKIASGPSDTQGTKEIASYLERLFTLKGDGIYELDSGISKIIEGEFNSNYLFYAYAGNLYLLDKSSESILRYSATPSGFSSGSEWLAPGIEINLSESVSWSFDGSVWISFANSDIYKLTRGSPEKFTPKGVSPSFNGNIYLFTNEELENIYILEPMTKRIVVLTKEGDFIAQYLNEELSKTTSLTVSEKEKKIIFPVEDKLKYIDLKHIE